MGKKKPSSKAKNTLKNKGKANKPIKRDGSRPLHGARGKDPRGYGGDDRQSQNLTPAHKDGFFLHGRHAITAALQNPKRKCLRLFATSKSAEDARELLDIRPELDIFMVQDSTIENVVGFDSPHQGLLMDVLPLPDAGHLEILEPKANQKNIILMLDQVTDPHNVGACMRSAAAFGARALITQDRNSPMESGVLARASSGALELLPWLRLPNLSQALDALKEMGYWSMGLDGNTEQTLSGLNLGDNVVIVMGSEGKGLRPLVAKHCDVIARIPMTDTIESLNVSNAAAIALYEVGMR